MSNKKLDALRRLLLGSLYQECKDNPMGVSREKITSHLQKLKDEGCIGDCTVDEFVKTCQLKSHYPTCLNNENRGCVEGVGERSTGVDKFYYNQYKRAKEIEDEPDTEDEESEEEEVCNICGLEEDEEGNPIKVMSCGHKSHISCLQKYYSMPTNRILLRPGDKDPETGEELRYFKDIDNARCPDCRKIFTFEEVPVQIRTESQRDIDSVSRADFNASQMDFEESSGVIGSRPNIEEEDEVNPLEEDIISQINLSNFYRALEYLKRANEGNEEIDINNIFQALLNKIKNIRSIRPPDMRDIKELYDEILNTNLKLTSEDLTLMKEVYEIDQTKKRIIKDMLTKYVNKIFNSDTTYFAQITYLKDIFVNDMIDFIKLTFEIFNNSSRLDTLKQRVEFIRGRNPNVSQEVDRLITSFL